MVRAGAGAGIFEKLEPEPHKNGPAPQHWLILIRNIILKFSLKLSNPNNDFGHVTQEPAATWQPCFYICKAIKLYILVKCMSEFFD
jgi:hypothetical protein